MHCTIQNDEVDLLALVDRLYLVECKRDNLKSITINDVHRAVAQRFGLGDESLDRKRKKLVKGRLMDLINGEASADSDEDNEDVKSNDDEDHKDHKDHEDYEGRDEAEVVLKEQEQDFFDQHNVHCQVCNQPGKVLCCATCNLVFHVDCVRPKLLEEAPNDWMCAYCCVDGLGGKNDEKERRKATQACREMERMTRECVKEHANENEGSSEGGLPCAAPSDDHFVLDMNDDDNNKDDDDYKCHEDNEDDEDDEDDEVDNKDDKDHDDDNVGAFSNEEEGGVPGVPHSTLIKKLHILNQTPTYQRSVIEKDEIDLLIKKLHQMKSRGEIGGKPCGLGTSWTYKKKRLENTELVGWLEEEILLKFIQK